MRPVDHVICEATWDAENQKLAIVDQVHYRASLRRMKPGGGEVFVIRVERQSEA